VEEVGKVSLQDSDLSQPSTLYAVLKPYVNPPLE
jgi:hypothetical protein